MNTKRIALILLIIGFVVILVSVADYLSGWSYLPEWFFLFGLLFVAFGHMINKDEE